MEEKHRHVEKLLSVFHLTIRHSLRLPREVRTGVLFLYDGQDGSKDFRLLDPGIGPEMRRRITAWLHEHVGPQDFSERLRLNRLDADGHLKNHPLP